MPMKPVAPRQHRADQEAAGGVLAEQREQHDQHNDADDRDGGVLTAQIGGCTLLHRLRDLLHARRAGIGGHDPRGGDDAVQHGDDAATDDGPKERIA
jgi:hypothetical protein